MTGRDATGLEALDLLPEAVLVLDADHVVVHANDRARAVLGVGTARLGRPLADTVTLLTDDGRPCADPVPPRGVAQRIAERELHVRLADGRERPVAMTGRFLADGRVVLSFRSAARRRAAARSRAELVAQVSHDLRSPIATILGFTRPLLTRWSELADDTRRTLVEAIEGDATRVAALIDELLLVARLDRGRLGVRPEPIDVAELAIGVVERARVRPAGEGRQIAVEVDPAAPSSVRADPRRVEQVLTNLVDNALLHAPDAAVEVTVAAGPDSGVVVTVADDGPGIPPELREHVFEKFGRGDATAPGGTGLGLFIARGLARAHGGDVTLADPHGPGTRVVLTLP